MARNRGTKARVARREMMKGFVDVVTELIEWAGVVLEDAGFVAKKRPRLLELGTTAVFITQQSIMTSCEGGTSILPRLAIWSYKTTKIETPKAELWPTL